MYYFHQLSDFLYQLAWVWHLTWHVKHNNTLPPSFFSLPPFLRTIYLTKGYVRLWYSKSTCWEILGRNLSWKQCNGFPIGVLYSVGCASLQCIFMYWSRWIKISTALNPKKKQQKLTFKSDRGVYICLPSWYSTVVHPTSPVGCLSSGSLSAAFIG